MRDSLIEKSFEWELTSDPDAIWPILSDTARLNQALGLPPYRISETFDRDSIRRRYGEMDEDGVRIRWEEPSFEWVYGCWWRWRRFYEEGPLRETGGILLLNRKPEGGTRVTYTLSIEPNGALGRILVASGHLKIAAQTLEKISKQADAHVQNPRGEFFSNLAASGTKKANGTAIPCVTKSAQDEELLARLASWLDVAPQADRVDLRSKRLARCFGVSESEALRACLLGVLGSALRQRYRAVCPSCRIGAIEMEHLIEIPPLLACRRCGSGYRRDLAGGIEVVFTAMADDDPDGSYCASGPSMSPHVTLQQNVGALERRDLAFELPPGAYLARAQDGAVSGIVELDTPSGVQVQLSESGIGLDTNSKDSFIENHCKRDFTVSVERCEWPVDALPVADFLTEQAFRDLEPDENLADGDSASVGFGAILCIGDLPDPLAAYSKGALYERDDGFYALGFVSVGDALDVAKALLKAHPEARFGVDCGPLTVATVGGRLTYIGTVPEQARSLCLAGHRGVIEVSARVREIVPSLPAGVQSSILTTTE